MAKELTTETEFDTQIASHRLTVVDFYADWCGPCKRFSPTFDKMAASHPNVNFCKVNVDNVDEVATRYNIRSIPCFHFFKNGNNLTNMTGASEEKLTKLVEQYCK